MRHDVTPQNLLVLFHKAAHLAMRELHHNGSHAQGRVLNLLSQQGKLGQKAILDQLGIRAASLSELLGKLEKNGLIVRCRDSLDKRSAVVEITDKGRAAASEAQSELQSSIAGLFTPLDEIERTTLAVLLNKLIAAWSAGTPKIDDSALVAPMNAVRTEA